MSMWYVLVRSAARIPFAADSLSRSSKTSAINPVFPGASPGRDADGGSAVHSELVSLIETMLTDGELDAALDDGTKPLQLFASSTFCIHINTTTSSITVCQNSGEQSTSMHL